VSFARFCLCTNEPPPPRACCRGCRDEQSARRTRPETPPLSLSLEIPVSAISPPFPRQMNKNKRQSPANLRHPKSSISHRGSHPSEISPSWLGGAEMGDLQDTCLPSCAVAAFSAEISYNGSSPPRQGPAVPPSPPFSIPQSADRPPNSRLLWVATASRCATSNSEHHARSQDLCACRTCLPASCSRSPDKVV
jgi:hypothetical protein